MTKRIVAWLLAVFLLVAYIPMASQAEELTTEEAYWENIELLSIYMRNDPEAPVDIATLRLGFQSLHHYQLSTEFSLYAQIMEYLENDDFNNAMSWLSILMLYPEFDEFVTSEEFSKQYPEIRGLEEMETYISARREEAAHNYNAASTLYKSCLKFYDAMERYQNLYVDLDVVVAETLEQIKSGDYASAIANAEYLIANGHERGQALYDVAVSQRDAASITPAPIATATPTPAETPSATPRIEVAAMTLTAGYSDSKSVLSWNAVPGAAKYIVYHARGKDKDMGSFAVLAETTSTKYADSEVIGGIFNSYQVEAIGSDGQVVGRSSIKSVYAVSQTWGLWSDWTTAEISEDSTTQVEAKTQYRSRSLSETKEYSDWGSWSSWNTNPINSGTLCEVEKKQEYRYRTLTTQTSSGDWSEWSNWSTTPVSSDAEREVQQQTEYRIRTSTQSIEYSPWSSWSDWRTSPITSTPLQDVQQRTEYRYRSSSTSTQYSAWSSWSDWSDVYQSSSSLKEVETRTVYPYYYFSCPNCGTRRHVWDQCPTWIGGCGKRFSSSSGWTTMWSTTPWSEARDWHGTGRTYISGPWFCWKSQSKKTQYRFRTRNVDQVTTWGSWSNWSTTYVSESSTRQVETRNAYRYRTRTRDERTIWGDWSTWSTTYASPSATREVDSRIVYRFRTRTTKAESVWGIWSDWSPTFVSESTTRQVETRTVYRYRTRTLQSVPVYSSWSEWTDVAIHSNSTTEVEKRTVYRFRKLQ